MTENKAESIKNHLEFLGYSVDSKLNPAGARLLEAKSSSKPNLAIWFGKPEENRQSVMFSSTWTGVKKLATLEQCLHLNKINGDLMVTKVYFDFTDDTLMFRAIYTADYDKKAFGDFLDTFFNGITQGMSGDEFKKLFLTDNK